MTERIDAIISYIEEKKGENIVVIDLTGVDGTICDYFVICEAQSTTQTEAISNEIEDKMNQEHGEKALRVQGRASGLWIVMDYGDIFVHMFERETRAYYGLEELWADVPMKQYESQY